MIPRLTTRIGIAAFVLVLIIALSAIMAGAQTPTPTETATPTSTPTATPAIQSFTVDISQSGEGNGEGLADVQLNVSFNDFEATTETPEPDAEGPTRGLIKYCYDMGAQGGATPPPTETASPTPGASPVQDASPSPGGAPIPTATENRMQAVPDTCVLSAEQEFTFTQVPEGEHTFLVELVSQDGTSFEPRLFIEITLNVIPPP